MKGAFQPRVAAEEGLDAARRQAAIGRKLLAGDGFIAGNVQAFRISAGLDLIDGVLPEAEIVNLDVEAISIKINPVMPAASLGHAVQPARGRISARVFHFLKAAAAELKREKGVWLHRLSSIHIGRAFIPFRRFHSKAIDEIPRVCYIFHWLKDVNVSGAMLSAALVGCLTSGTENAVDNVHLTSGEGRRNSVASSFVIAGSLVGSSTLSSITNCSVENTDVAVGPYGIGGALGGGLSRPILNNCSAKNCTVRADRPRLSLRPRRNDSFRRDAERRRDQFRRQGNEVKLPCLPALRPGSERRIFCQKKTPAWSGGSGKLKAMSPFEKPCAIIKEVCQPRIK